MIKQINEVTWPCLPIWVREERDSNHLASNSLGPESLHKVLFTVISVSDMVCNCTQVFTSGFLKRTNGQIKLLDLQNRRISQLPYAPLNSCDPWLNIYRSALSGLGLIKGELYYLPGKDNKQVTTRAHVSWSGHRQVWVMETREAQTLNWEKKKCLK